MTEKPCEHNFVERKRTHTYQGKTKTITIEERCSKCKETRTRTEIEDM